MPPAISPNLSSIIAVRARDSEATVRLYRLSVETSGDNELYNISATYSLQIGCRIFRVLGTEQPWIVPPPPRRCLSGDRAP
jgi:hypothetical protein